MKAELGCTTAENKKGEKINPAVKDVNYGRQLKKVVTYNYRTDGTITTEIKTKIKFKDRCVEMIISRFQSW